MFWGGYIDKALAGSVAHAATRMSRAPRSLAYRIAAKGELRRRYAHIIDMVPTVLNSLGLDPPGEIRGVTQSPLHSV